MAREKAPKQISVVGRNLYAALALDTLQKENNVELSWIQHKEDTKQRDSQHWLYFPDLRKLSFPISEAIFVKPDRISIYLDSGQRIPLPRFIEEGMMQTSSGSFPSLPVRNKIYATAIWNDLTPPLWRKGLPNVSWPKEVSAATQISNWAGPALIPREKSLLSAEEIFKKEGVSIAPKNKCVLSIESGRLGDDNHLLHNAPHAFSRSQYTVWNTPNDANLKQQRSVVARWVSYFTEVEKRLVAPLPLISIWLHHKHNSEFLETGLISTGCMSRVIVIPQTGMEKDLLQIQELEFLPIRQRQAKDRVDSFLWRICPYLQGVPLQFERVLSDEDALFANPDEILQRIGRRSFFYWQGPMGNPDSIKGKIL